MRSAKITGNAINVKSKDQRPKTKGQRPKYEVQIAKHYITVETRNRNRLLTLASLLCGSLFLFSLERQLFIFERLDPNGVPNPNERAVRWSEYYQATWAFKVVAVVSLFLMIWVVVATIRGRRRVKLEQEAETYLTV